MPEARNLLNDVWRDAEQVGRRTGSLVNFANSPNIDRTMQDNQLEHIQAKVDEMNDRLIRLEGMKQSVPASDQRAIDQALHLVQLMATGTTAAISDLNANIQYGGYAQILNEEARSVGQGMKNGEQGADVQERATYDQENLGELSAFGK